jgi:mannose-6-phosphate isomerase-like protein (cupin superfamily)
LHRYKYSNYSPEIQDYGPAPLIVDIERFTKINQNYRTALWTGEHLQVTLMSIPVGGDIGLEIHPNLDQFIRIESGSALVVMGSTRCALNYQQRVNNNYAVIIPADTWHNVINTGNTPLKLYSIYAPPQHPFGTVHETKKVAEAAENY